MGLGFELIAVEGEKLFIWRDRSTRTWKVTPASRRDHGFTLSEGPTRAEALARLDRSRVGRSAPTVERLTPDEAAAVEVTKWRALVDDLIADAEREVIRPVDEATTLVEIIHAALAAPAARYRAAATKAR